MKAKAEIYLDARPKADGLHNVKLRVYFNRKYRYYSTDVYLRPDEFEKVMFGKRKTMEQKEILTKLNHYLTKAEKIIDKIGVFTFGGFEELYFESRDIYTSVSYAFDKRIAELRENKQIGTALTYDTAKKSLNTFKKNLQFSEITPGFLKRYENWMIDNGKSVTTIGMYLRNLRALFNRQKISSKLYPFGRGKYEIPTARNIKKALTLDEIARIYNYEAESGSWEEMARDYWIFLYLANGMNVKDFCLLKWSNINGDVISYVRAKTRNTEKEVKVIRVDLKPEMKAIIQKYGKPSINNETYIFPHITADMTADKQRAVHQQLTKIINKYMKRVGILVGVRQDVTTYFARHSFATILKRSGANVSMISDLLGHNNVATTESYLAGFEDDQIKKQTDVLTAGFNKKTV